MPKKDDPFIKRDPIFHDGTKMCAGECGQDLPATSDYFDRDGDKPDGLKNVCKACRALTHSRNEMKRIDDRIKKLDEGSMNLLEALTRTGSEIPHISELYQRLMEVFEGAGGFAAHFMAQYLMAKPGSAVRQKMLETVIRLGTKVTEAGSAQLPVDAMRDEDLQIVFEKGARRMLRISGDVDGQTKEAS